MAPLPEVPGSFAVAFSLALRDVRLSVARTESAMYRDKLNAFFEEHGRGLDPGGRMQLSASVAVAVLSLVMAGFWLTG